MHYLKSMLGAAIAVAVMLPAAGAAEPGKANGKNHAAAHGKDHAKAAAPAAHAKRDKVAHAAATKSERPSRRVVTQVRADNYFDRNEEAAIRRYYATSAACPPGLAAKRNGCLPPGQAKKAWAVGSALPRDVTLAPLPGDLLGRLPVTPNGYSYGRYDGDVYLVENATRRIIDTIVVKLAR